MTRGLLFSLPGLISLPALMVLCASCTTIGEDEIERGTAAAPEFPADRADARAAAAAGWREWRGPRRDGRVAGERLPRDFPRGEWPALWRVPVGEGLSGPVVDEERVYCHARVEGDEVVSAHDPRSGDVLWRRANSIRSWSQPFPAARITGGPLATPALADGRLYTVGVHGRTQCLDVRDGRLIFAVGAEQLDGRRSAFYYGHAASPLVREGRLYVSFSVGRGGHFVALDARTGELLWRALEETVAYVSPVHARLEGQEQIVVRTWERVVGLRPDSGEVLWSHAARARGVRRDCATPLVVGDAVYVTNDFHGTIALRVSRDGDRWRSERVFRTGALGGRTASPVFHEGFLYGLHRKGYVSCIDARTGERAWVARDFDDHLSIITFGDRALALDEEGNLALLELSPVEYRPLERWKVGEYTWAHPAVGATALFLRDGVDLVCLPFEPVDEKR